MRYTAIVVLLAMWLTFAFTNASPLPAKTDRGTGKINIQKLIEGVAKTKEVSHPYYEANAQSCGWIDWGYCAGVVATCAASCFTLNAPACINCLGDSYDQCADCVSDYFTYNMEKIQKQEEKMKSQNALILPHNAATAQSCGWIDWGYCAGVVATCAASCFTLNAPACINCLGDSYDQCADCVSDYFTYKMEKIQKQGIIMQSQNPHLHHVPDGMMKSSQNALNSPHSGVNEERMKSQKPLISPHNAATAQGCGFSDWAYCAGVVAQCVGSCYSLDAPACFNCLGDSYDQCVGCVSDYFTYKLEKIQKQGMAKSSQNALSSPHSGVNEERIKSQKALISPHNAATAQSCDSLLGYCIAVLVDCASDYSCTDDIEESSCVTCFGDLYYACISCFSEYRLEDQLESRLELMMN